MKRIAIVNSVYKIGSTGRICFELSNYLTNEGFETLNCFGRNKINEKDCFYFGNKLSIWTHGIFTRLFDRHGRCSNFATKKLIKKLDSYKPDLVILNNLHGYYLSYPILFDYLKKSNIPVIMIFHDCWNFTGHCAHFLYNGCDKWKDGCKKCPHLNSYPKSSLFSQSEKNFKIKKDSFLSINQMTIVCPSAWMSSLVKNSFFRNSEIKVVNNGINLDVFHKNETSNFKEIYGLVGKKVILSVAYVFDKKKGIDDILKLSRLLKNDEKIVIVGKLKNKVQIPDNVIYIKETNNINGLVDAYSNCDVFFNATYEDTYSNVNMEAMSCGLPIVCYNSGGACEMIDKRFAVKTGDINAAYEKISELLSGKQSYNFENVANFSSKNTYKKYLEIIRKVLGDENIGD